MEEPLTDDLAPVMRLGLTAEQEAIRVAVSELCARYPHEYWRDCDVARRYPQEFVDALTEAGWLSILIPEEYGGAGLTITEGAIVLEAINRSGGTGTVAHAQMYTMGTMLRHGSEDQKRRYLPLIAEGKLRMQSFGVTEPNAGSDTTRIETFAVRRGDHYVINGSKMWTSRVQHTDLMLLLARTTPYDQVEKKHDGLSVFIVDLREAGDAVKAHPIKTMINHETNQLFITDLKVPVENLIGEEGKGFRYILSGMNAERILISSEILGDGFWFVEKASQYASTRVVFGRPIGANQGVQFPIAQAYANLEAASLMRFQAAQLFDAHQPCGAQANMAKLLAADASWEAANACLQFHGGFGFACEYDVERKFRETRLYQVAPISTNLILSYVAEHVLGLPRSF